MKLTRSDQYVKETDSNGTAEPRPLTRTDLGDGASWEDRANILTLVFGHYGVTAIYLRALQCGEIQYPWLSKVREQTRSLTPFAALHGRLSSCTPDTATAVHRFLLEQFDSQVTLLVGEPLAQRLLTMVRSREEGTDTPLAPPPEQIGEQLILTALSAAADARLARHERDEARSVSEQDELTGTANRSRMLDRLKSAIALANRTGTPTAVLFIDLDRFKQINDDQGHGAGDAMLREVGTRLQEAVRKTDTVCRYGGDEFVVILTPMERRSEAAPAAARMLLAIEKVRGADPCVPALTASIGIGLYPEHGTSPEALLNRADRSMYSHKRRQSDPLPAASDDDPCVQPAIPARPRADVPLVYGALASLTLKE